MENYQITQWCHRFIEEQVKDGDYCIDATCGNGLAMLYWLSPILVE